MIESKMFQYASISLDLKERGWSFQKIAERLNISTSTAKRAVKIAEINKRLGFNPYKNFLWWNRMSEHSKRSGEELIEAANYVSDMIRLSRDSSEQKELDELDETDWTDELEGAAETDGSQKDEFDDLL